MNFWTGLILGIIIGWLVEWAIDWLFWRRDAEEADLLMRDRLAASSRGSTAEWSDSSSISDDQGQGLVADGQVLAATETDSYPDDDWLAGEVDLAGVSDEEFYDSLLDGDIVDEDLDYEEEMVVAVEDLAIVDEDIPAEAAPWPAERPFDGAGEPGFAGGAEGEYGDIIERLHLAGIDSLDELTEADPAGLSVALGLSADETEEWIERVAGALPDGDAEKGVRAGFSLDIETAEADDLTRVHGIGPKYAATLTTAGITTFEQLAAASPDELREIINPGVMQKPDFAGWSMQAAALRDVVVVQTGDDLTVLDGIGPVYAAKLRDNGIATFAELAATDEDRLGEIIAAPAWRRIQFGEWITQAELAAAGDQIALREFQDRLFRRGGDNLTLISGLGNRSATAFRAAGYDSFATVAEATPQQLENVLQEAGIRGGFNYEAWISEAGLRAAGKRISRPKAKSAEVVACPQDLSAVDGIGSVYEDRLYAAGIGSYWSLAGLTDDALAAILEARAGVDLEAIKSSAMKLAIETNSQGRTWSGTPPDNFEALVGIGELYERRLYSAGICTYEALAATSPERLAEICQAPAMQMPDYAAWVTTATELVAARSG